MADVYHPEEPLHQMWPQYSLRAWLNDNTLHDKHFAV